MSKATKRKHVTREVLDEFVKPDPKQIIVKIIGSRGNNLHEAETADGKKFLISMPSKFRKNVWIKRGNFVIVDPIKEGQKVCGEIAHILYKEQVKYLKREGLWPQEFLNEDNFCVTSHQNDGGKKLELNVDDSGTDSSTDDELFVNPNHAQTLIMHSDSSSDEEVSEEGNETVSNNDE